MSCWIAATPKPCLSPREVAWTPLIPAAWNTLLNNRHADCRCIGQYRALLNGEISAICTNSTSKPLGIGTCLKTPRFLCFRVSKVSARLPVSTLIGLSWSASDNRQPVYTRTWQSSFVSESKDADALRKSWRSFSVRYFLTPDLEIRDNSSEINFKAKHHVTE